MYPKSVDTSRTFIYFTGMDKYELDLWAQSGYKLPDTEFDPTQPQETLSWFFNAVLRHIAVPYRVLQAVTREKGQLLRLGKETVRRYAQMEEQQEGVEERIAKALDAHKRALQKISNMKRAIKKAKLRYCTATVTLKVLEDEDEQTAAG